MSRQNNCRRTFKLILKDYSRGKFSEPDSLEKFMETFGFYNCQLWQIELFLKTKIKSKIVNRIRKAALKKGKLVSLFDFVLVYKKKMGELNYPHFQNIPSDYHFIPFIKVSYKEREYIEVIKIIEKDGLPPLEISVGFKKSGELNK